MRRRAAGGREAALLCGALAGALLAPCAFAAERSAPATAVPAAPTVHGAPAISAAPAVPTAPAAAAAAPPASGAPTAAEDIRDIRGPKPIASPWLVPAVGGGACLLAVLGYLLWRWLRRRKIEPGLSPVEVALRRLEAARALLQPGQCREFSIEVSAAVREYIESRFGVMAAHRTTHEFLHDLLTSADAGLAGHRELLGEFLQSCDLAKFGGWNLGIEQMGSMLESARRFIRSAAAPAAAADPAPAAPGPAPASRESRVSLSST